MAEGGGKKKQRVWWGEYSIPHGKSARFRIGPLSLVVTRLDNEWRVWRGHVENGGNGELSIQVPSSDNEPASDAVMVRYGTSDEDESLLLEPTMPDRSVVTRPEHPITVPPKDSVTVYVGSPLWMRVSAGSPKKVLGDFPADTPQHTWWGPNTMEGESCYATTTYGRLRLVDARPGPHRVMTAARIVNRAAEPLVIERMNLPVKNLSVYAENGSCRLWTEAVTLERAEGEEFATLELEDDPGSDVDKFELVGAAREPPSKNQLFRAFGKLFK